MKHAFVFSLEAAISLLIAIGMISNLHYLRLSTYSDFYLQELLSDFQQIAAKGYYADIVEFSKGDSIAKNKLESEFSNIIANMGDYCVIFEAKFNKLEVNCKTKKSNYQHKISDEHIWFDGDDFFEFKITLIE